MKGFKVEKPSPEVQLLMRILRTLKWLLIVNVMALAIVVFL